MTLWPPPAGFRVLVPSHAIPWEPVPHSKSSALVSIEAPNLENVLWASGNGTKKREQRPGGRHSFVRTRTRKALVATFGTKT